MVLLMEHLFLFFSIHESFCVELTLRLGSGPGSRIVTRIVTCVIDMVDMHGPAIRVRARVTDRIGLGRRVGLRSRLRERSTHRVRSRL